MLKEFFSVLSFSYNYKIIISVIKWFCRSSCYSFCKIFRWIISALGTLSSHDTNSPSIDMNQTMANPYTAWYQFEPRFLLSSWFA